MVKLLTLPDSKDPKAGKDSVSFLPKFIKNKKINNDSILYCTNDKNWSLFLIIFLLHCDTASALQYKRNCPLKLAFLTRVKVRNFAVYCPSSQKNINSLNNMTLNLLDIFQH